MKKVNVEKLERTLEVMLEDINDMEPGSKERAQAVLDYTNLAKMLNDYEIKMREIDNQSITANNNEVHRDEDRKSERRKHIINCILTGASIIVPAATYGFITLKGLKFEEKGTIGSPLVKGAFNKINANPGKIIK